MKILYILKSFAAKGGEERVMADKMNYLAEKGNEIILITSEQGEHAFAYPLHRNISHIDLNTRFFTISNQSLVKKTISLYLMRRQFIKRLTIIVNNLRPDIITSTIVPIKNIRLITQVCKSANIPLILESHLAYKASIKQNDYASNTPKRIIAKLFDKWNLRPIRYCSRLITLTKGDADNWHKYCKSVIAIPNPVTYIPDTTNDIPKIPKRIIAVGRLHSQKGFDLLIKAFSLIASEIPEWHIDIYGNGTDKETLMKLIHERGLDARINLKGETDDIYNEYKKSQFFVLSSRYEGFGLVLIEAMSCGIPCVSFKCDYGPEDIITDGVDGILVEDGDIEDLAKKILLMATNEGKRMDMGMEARNKVMLFDKNVIMPTWIKLFESIISSHH